MMKAFVSNGSNVCALRPQSMATRGLGVPSAFVLAFNARIAASVTAPNLCPGGCSDGRPPRSGTC